MKVPYICSLDNELIKSEKRDVAGNFTLLLIPSPFARYSFNYLETLQRLIVIGNNNKFFLNERNYSSIKKSSI